MHTIKVISHATNFGGKDQSPSFVKRQRPSKKRINKEGERSHYLKLNLSRGIVIHSQSLLDGNFIA